MSNAMVKKGYDAIKEYASSGAVKKMFADIVGGQHAQGYIFSVMVAVSQNPLLQQCSPQSIIRSAARAATLGLSCDPAIGQAYIVPYKGEASLQPGWKGIRDMAYRTGNIKAINVGVVVEGQEWVADLITGRAKIEGTAKSNKPIGYFAYMETHTGREHFEYMTKEQIEEHRNRYAQGHNRPGSSWVTSFDAMAKKTVLSRLLKIWAELDPLGSQQYIQAERILKTDEMPDPDEVEPSLSDAIDAEFEDIEIEIVTADDEPEREPDEQKPTNIPATAGELYTWITQGALPGITVKQARDVVKKSNDQIDIAWEILRGMAQGKLI